VIWYVVPWGIQSLVPWENQLVIPTCDGCVLCWRCAAGRV